MIARSIYLMSCMRQLRDNEVRELSLVGANIARAQVGVEYHDAAGVPVLGSKANCEHMVFYCCRK